MITSLLLFSVSVNLLVIEAWLPACSVIYHSATGSFSGSSRSFHPFVRPRRWILRQISSQQYGRDDIDRRWEDIPELNDEKEGDTPPLETEPEDAARNDARERGSQNQDRFRQTFYGKGYVTTDISRRGPPSLMEMDEESFFCREVFTVQSGHGIEDDVEDLMDLAGNLLCDEEDSLFLEEETYVQYSMENGTGMVCSYDRLGRALRPIMFESDILQFATPPDASYGNTDLEPSLDDLLRLQQARIQRGPPTSEEEKKIFEEVFKDERSFLELTSDIFKEGLTNKTTANEATKIRRGGQYRRKLLQEIGKLESQIEDFQRVLVGEMENEKVLLHGDASIAAAGTSLGRDNTFTTSQSLFKSGTVQEEILNYTRLVSRDDDGSGEWVSVDDPSTGANKITDEMKEDEGT